MSEQYATYCPEDNKLRLYIGRVPREEFLKLRAEGWTTLHKQREAGGGDFVAIWTPTRRDTAIAYGDGVILDEDMGPEERAADRAERFGGYRDKREGEATGHADQYDSGPQAHGFQSQARAERAAARHDKIADRAGDAWSKAEYWQRRTAGVIGHALHVSSPDVRMGRIKELEADIRRSEKSRAEYEESRARWVACAAMTDAAEQTKRAALISGACSGCYSYKHPRPEQVKNAHIREHGSSLWTLLEMSGGEYGEPITGAEACALYLAAHGPLATEGDWLTHYRLRLAYENQMLEAQGGRAGAVEMVAGGWLCGGRRLSGEERRIVKVNKSPTSGRVVSVLVRDNRPSERNHWGNPWPDGVAKVLSHTVEVERADPDAYRAPTPEELATFQEEEKAAKKERKASAPAPTPLINPTDEDAERLQSIWNAAAMAERVESYARMHYSLPVTDCSPQAVLRMSQARYMELSKGAYARVSTANICRAAIKEPTRYNYDGRHGAPVCKIRRTSGDHYSADRVIILTDKPQKALPVAVWQAAKAKTEATILVSP